MKTNFKCECCKSTKAAYMNYWYQSDGKTFCSQDCLFEYKAWGDAK